MDNKENIISSGLLEQYVLGLTSIEEGQKVEGYVKRYPELKLHIEQLQKGLEDYAKLHATPPPQNLKGEVLTEIDRLERKANEEADGKIEDTSSNRTIIYRLISGVAALLIFALTALCYLLYQNQQDANQQLGSLSEKVAVLNDRYEDLKNDNEQIKEQYALLKDAKTHHVHMRGTNVNPKVQAVIYHNLNRKDTYLNIVNLPKPPHGHQYQVWADVKGKHHNMGLLEVEPDTNTLVSLPFIENCRGFVVTIEKSGGSPHPTVEKMLVKGEL